MFNKWFKKLKKACAATILCIRFPFLYPRNRFTDTHYNNWEFRDKIKSLRDKGNIKLHVTSCDESVLCGSSEDKSTKFCVNLSKTEYTESVTIDEKIMSVRLKDNKVYIFNDINLEILDLHEIMENPEWIESAYIQKTWKRVGYGKNIVEKVTYALALIHKEDVDLKIKFHIVNFILDVWKLRLANVLEWYHNTILQLFHCIPTYTELDAMPNGWRKKFGISMCKDIRHALIKSGWKYLFTYRIEQIKEKFGTLRWYDSFEPKDSGIFDIISKYEDISYRTCINCGKDAKWISKGWISPYCDDCIGDTDNATPLK